MDYTNVKEYKVLGLPTNRNNAQFKQLTVQTNRKKESNVKQVLDVPVNISYHEVLRYTLQTIRNSHTPYKHTTHPFHTLGLDRYIS